MEKIVTLVPWRGGEPRREWLWDCTQPALQGLGYPIYTGDSDGEWARAAAMNRASEAAGDWDIALLGDADTIPEMGSILRAVEWVKSTRGAARPHHNRWMLTEAGTLEFVRRGVEALKYPLHYDKQFFGGGLLVVHREAWEAAEGFDERFVGWGREDSCFNLRCLSRSTWDRLPGNAYHLWHPRHTEGASRTSEDMYRKMLRNYMPDIQEWNRDKGYPHPEEIF